MQKNDQELAEVESLQLKLEFSNPNLVSVFDRDFVMVKISKEIFLDEVESTQPEEIVFIDMQNIIRGKQTEVHPSLTEDQL